MLNETHDPRCGSWIASANQPHSDFPLQNLPFGVFRRVGASETFRCGIAIGDQILDLTAAIASGALQATVADAEGFAAASAALTCAATLNALMQAGARACSALRLTLCRALRSDSVQRRALEGCLIPQSQAQMALPARIGDYTDFYASIYHATAVGRLFRPEQPLLPNYRWLPVGYHGRSSSIGVSPQWFHRPAGQTRPDEAPAPPMRASGRLDFELELGVFIGPGNAAGTAIGIGEAESHIFGLCLLNDWSARDLQAWEAQPLGPFLSKNFATTISPWIVTLEALAPFRLPWHRAAEEPQPLPYLDAPALRGAGAIDIELEVALQTESMRREGVAPERITRSNFRHCYWNIAQLIAHHTINGCNLCAGDLLGSGTQSGPLPEEAGSLLELTYAGKQPLRLASGETRSFLQDGDSVTLRGWCARAGAARIGFGEASGGVLAAHAGRFAA
ncbi:MAG TPA: fumarylacetoacetase [Steroidobacteraceae bacterium]|jgi:fumarylacetoacetase|nr:fumarylacetoacetase [Steroidobacteraceae bacterium]